MKAQLEANPNAVIDDVRFDNEAALVTSSKGTIVYIDRPTLKSEDLHASEVVPTDKANHTIVNKFIIEDFTNSVESLYWELKWLETRGKQTK